MFYLVIRYNIHKSIHPKYNLTYKYQGIRITFSVCISQTINSEFDPFRITLEYMYLLNPVRIEFNTVVIVSLSRNVVS